MWPRSAIVLIVSTLVLIVSLPAAAAATPWAKISGDRVSSIDQATLLANGSRVLAAWPAGDGTALAGALELRGFAPTLARPGNGAGPVAVVASGFTTMSTHPALIATPTGPRAIFVATRPDGQTRLYLSEPLTEGAAPAAPPAELVRSRGGNLDAVGLADGTPLVADDLAGSLRVVRGASADLDAPGTSIQAQLGGNSYNPALGTDAAGGVWLAWYSNAAPAGLLVQAIDPATGGAIGTPTRVPGSGSVANNSAQRVALVGDPAGSGARVVYATQTAVGAPLRIVSWAPGDAAPTTVARPGNLTLNSYVAAARHADGRLWVAWYDDAAGAAGATRGFYAKLGDARGAGGVEVPLGMPTRTATPGAVTALPRGDDLLVAAVAGTGATRNALWATLSPEVLIANPQTIRSGLATVVAPRRISLGALRASRTKCVYVRVRAAAPSRVQVSIFSGTRSIRLFGQKGVVFRAPGSKVVCVRVPLRARTFDVRTPLRIAVATKAGARPIRGERPGSLGIARLRLFR